MIEGVQEMEKRLFRTIIETVIKVTIFVVFNTTGKLGEKKQRGKKYYINLIKST